MRGPRDETDRRRTNRASTSGRPLHTLLGVDLAQIHGLGPYAALKLVSECGNDMSRWPTAKHFTSWLTLCARQQDIGGQGAELEDAAIVEPRRAPSSPRGRQCRTDEHRARGFLPTAGDAIVCQSWGRRSVRRLPAGPRSTRSAASATRRTACLARQFSIAAIRIPGLLVVAAETGVVGQAIEPNPRLSGALCEALCPLKDTARPPPPTEGGADGQALHVGGIPASGQCQIIGSDPVTVPAVGA